MTDIKKKNADFFLILKVIGWRMTSFIVGSIVSFLYLGELRSSINLIAILNVVLPVCHYIYEKTWHRYENMWRKNEERRS